MSEITTTILTYSDTEACKTCNGSGRIVLRDENGKIKKPDGFKSVELDKYL